MNDPLPPVPMHLGRWKHEIHHLKHDVIAFLSPPICREQSLKALNTILEDFQLQISLNLSLWQELQKYRRKEEERLSGNGKQYVVVDAAEIRQMRDEQQEGRKAYARLRSEYMMIREKCDAAIKELNEKAGFP